MRFKKFINETTTVSGIAQYADKIGSHYKRNKDRWKKLSKKDAIKSAIIDFYKQNKLDQNYSRTEFDKITREWEKTWD